MRNLIQTVSDSVRRYFAPAQAVIEPIRDRLSGSKVLLSVGKNPGDFDSEDWYQEFKRKNDAAVERGEDAQSAALCPYPGCEGHMLSGPEGGMSVNIKCDTCERKWNLTSMIERMERI